MKRRKVIIAEIFASDLIMENAHMVQIASLNISVEYAINWGMGLIIVGMVTMQMIGMTREIITIITRNEGMTITAIANMGEVEPKRFHHK